MEDISKKFSKMKTIDSHKMETKSFGTHMDISADIAELEKFYSNKTWLENKWNPRVNRWYQIW